MYGNFARFMVVTVCISGTTLRRMRMAHYRHVIYNISTTQNVLNCAIIVVRMGSISGMRVEIHSG
jgi:hypothetical protein